MYYYLNYDNIVIIHFCIMVLYSILTLNMIYKEIQIHNKIFNITILYLIGI